MDKNGFTNIKVSIDVLPMRVAVLEDFLHGQFLASPIAADIDILNEEARSELFEEIGKNLLPFMDDGGLAVPFEAHSATAYR